MSNLTLCFGDVLEEVVFEEKKGVSFSTRRHLNELLVCTYVQPHACWDR